ncbi:ATP-binding protein [Gryllotalpicola sp.]|uniref:sensor histidine kinase n=1 Tax=Gryllotalpicola sp. TaxID=1932787 RepID=UPI0026045CB1|nr:ATP-binding protein [Gryllotalpicola sp.]
MTRTVPRPRGRSDAAPDERRDDRRYRRVFFVATAAALAIFAAGSAFQSAVLQIRGESIPIGPRLLANICGSLLIVVPAWFVPMRRMPWPAKIAFLVGASVVAAVARGALQVDFGVHAFGDTGALLLDVIPASITSAFSITTALALAEFQNRVVQEERTSAERARVASSALEALRDEELRVRRDVADGLHGTVQQQLVMLNIHLAHTAEKLAQDDPREAEIARDLGWVRDELDRLREQGVRDVSRMLFPVGIDLGLVHAARILIGRIPPSIAVTTQIDESVAVAETATPGGLPFELRILAIRVLEEAVTNALRHGKATALRISLAVDSAGVLQVEVDDDGDGVDPAAVPSGLKRLEERLATRGGRLALASRPGGGATVSALLPLTGEDVL